MTLTSQSPKIPYYALNDRSGGNEFSSSLRGNGMLALKFLPTRNFSLCY